MPAWNTRKRFQVQAVSAVAMALLFLAWLRSEWGGQTVTLWVSDLAQLLVASAAAGACWWRSRHSRVMSPRGWYFMAAACGAWAVGQAVWCYYELVLGVEVPGVSVADTGFLLFLVLAAAGLFHFARVEPHRPARVRALLDALTGAAALLFVAWYFVVGEAVTAGASSALEWTVNLSYPIGDVVLLSLTLFALVRSARHARAGLAILCAGLVAMMVADFWFLFLSLREDYVTGNTVDAVWIIGFQLIGMAAVTPPAVPGPPTPLHEGMVAASPALPFVLALSTAVVAQVQQGFLSPFLTWNAMVFIVLVVVRQSLLVVDNLLLKRRAEESVSQLIEEKARRSRLLNNITHDLLSPLTPVNIQLSLLDDQDLNEEQHKAVKITRRNVERVLRMATDLKDLANLEEGGLRIDPVATDLAVLASSAGESFQAQAEGKGVRLHVETPGSAPVRADPVRLQQVLGNLLSNAVKFTAQGTITLRVQRGEDQDWRVEVTDTGRGLDAEEQARLFQPFVQVHDRSGQDVADRGTGLGLSICKGIVEGHGGRIGVTSDGQGTGSTFWFTVPEAVAAP